MSKYVALFHSRFESVVFLSCWENAAAFPMHGEGAQHLFFGWEPVVFLDALNLVSGNILRPSVVGHG